MVHHHCQAKSLSAGNDRNLMQRRTVFAMNVYKCVTGFMICSQFPFVVGNNPAAPFRTETNFIPRVFKVCLCRCSMIVAGGQQSGFIH